MSRVEHRRAAKEHECDACLKPIVKGERHEVYTHFPGEADDFGQSRLHLACAEHISWFARDVLQVMPGEGYLPLNRDEVEEFERFVAQAEAGSTGPAVTA